MASLFSETLPKFTAETLKLAAKQSERCHVVPDRLRRAIDNYLRDQEVLDMNRKVLRLAQTFNGIKEASLLLPNSTSKELVEDPLKSMESSQRWKVKSAYGDIGLRYQDDQTVAYVAARMPAVYSALHRVLSEVKRRVPDFSPAKVLDFGAGTGSALWAMMEVWPGKMEQINLVEPSQSMQRAGQSLAKDLSELPLIQSYSSLQALTKKINKSGRRHDLVIASYVLGEIPSINDRITLVRQLWDLTGDILRRQVQVYHLPVELFYSSLNPHAFLQYGDFHKLFSCYNADQEILFNINKGPTLRYVLVEPGTPQGSNIISQMRSHILWMEKRRSRKLLNAAKKTSKDLMTLDTGAFIVAPCPHDGACPLLNTNKYCHFVQRLERTPSQRLYKRSKGPLRGYEDEKFCYVAFRRGTRPREAWPLDGMKFETLKEMKANRLPEDLEMELENQLESDQDLDMLEETDANAGSENDDAEDEGEGEEEGPHADLGSGWGRIIYMPFRRGKRVELDMCRATNSEGTKGSFDRVVITQRQNPVLHHQARRSMWGDLWPLRSGINSKYYM